jgi:8-oxo-dGTP pyrophosphatase MutT (NUDIX family)
MTVALPPLNRVLIRERLRTVGDGPAIGDVDTAFRLMAEGNLEALTAEGFGPPPPATTAIPYEKGAGAPGVQFTLIPAAVLVPLIEYPDGYHVLLTQRTESLKHHAGQVAFPGGRMEPEDGDHETCALREAQEETGLDPARVEILGRLRPYLTITGYEVVPVVGAVTPPISLQRQPTEVASVFEVPLAFFLDAANHHRITREYNGFTRAAYAMPYGDRYIWGATAGMLLNLYQALTMTNPAATNTSAA